MANNGESISSKVYSYTAGKLHQLSEISETGAGKGELAALRRGLGKVPGELPELWGMLFMDMPEELMGKSSKSSESEWAVYISLTLFALHFQSGKEKSENVNTDGISLGRAAARLTETDDDVERIMKRLTQVSLSISARELENHLRSMITLLKSNDIGLDYAELAKDIFLFQFPKYVNDVRLKWGRDFYSEISKRRSKNE